ncbi:hypothetical protein D9756_001244 [Leucocoprinus leucothites]|uniref:Xylanolytic transcriptional activator regulatory domain-containing protein n=1 Tax=Leucocoprinus leucothites TaxID=201217 RepID=A0A8H5G3T6_9AGAR|nr:hypothetical protein D9756_001244 [Leucoagaricus leucothites]
MLVKFYTTNPDLHSRLTRLAEKLAFSVPAKRYKSVEIVQAYLLLSLRGCGPVERYEQDKTRLLLGMAIRMATGLNLHHKTAITSPNTAEGKAHDVEVHNCKWTWILCFCLDKSFSAQMGKLHLIKEETETAVLDWEEYVGKFDVEEERFDVDWDEYNWMDVIKRIRRNGFAYPHNKPVAFGSHCLVAVPSDISYELVLLCATLKEILGLVLLRATPKKNTELIYNRQASDWESHPRVIHHPWHMPKNRPDSLRTNYEGSQSEESDHESPTSRLTSSEEPESPSWISEINDQTENYSDYESDENPNSSNSIDSIFRTNITPDTQQRIIELILERHPSIVVPECPIAHLPTIVEEQTPHTSQRASLNNSEVIFNQKVNPNNQPNPESLKTTPQSNPESLKTLFSHNNSPTFQPLQQNHLYSQLSKDKEADTTKKNT